MFRSPIIGSTPRGHGGGHEDDAGDHHQYARHPGVLRLGLVLGLPRRGERAAADGDEGRADGDIGRVHRPSSDADGRYSIRPRPWTATIRPMISRITAVWLPVFASPSAPRRR